jgi:hypothetical protein
MQRGVLSLHAAAADASEMTQREREKAAVYSSREQHCTYAMHLWIRWEALHKLCRLWQARQSDHFFDSSCRGEKGPSAEVVARLHCSELWTDTPSLHALGDKTCAISEWVEWVRSLFWLFICWSGFAGILMAIEMLFPLVVGVSGCHGLHDAFRHARIMRWQKYKRSTYPVYFSYKVLPAAFPTECRSRFVVTYLYSQTYCIFHACTSYLLKERQTLHITPFGHVQIIAKINLTKFGRIYYVLTKSSNKLNVDFFWQLYFKMVWWLKMVLKVNMSSSQYNLIEWIRLKNIIFYFNFIYFGTDGVIDKLMGVVSSIFQYECVAHSQRTQGKTERNLCGSMGWSERVLCKSQSMHAACRALQCHRLTAEREAFVSHQSPPP